MSGSVPLPLAATATRSEHVDDSDVDDDTIVVVDDVDFTPAVAMLSHDSARECNALGKPSSSVDIVNADNSSNGNGSSSNGSSEGDATRSAATVATAAVAAPALPATAVAAAAAAAATRPAAAAAMHNGARTRTAFVRVLDYGVTAEQGTRRTMEDQHRMVSGGVPFFGVYDGHGGMQCAEFLRDNLHTMILGHADLKTHPERAIRESIIAADRAFLQRSEAETNESGSVCAVALIVDDLLVVGNVGDCEAVLSRNGTPIVLTVKHKLQSNAAELERVRALGGKIFHNRVGHPKFNPSVISLAVTRAIGDAGFKLDEYTDGKPSGVIAVPDTSSTRLTSEDDFFVIGCDGLWDVMSYEEVVDFCRSHFAAGESAQTVTESLARAALHKGSTDNVTTMLVCLKQRNPRVGGHTVAVARDPMLSMS